MNLRDFSAIARPVDFRYPTNRAITIVVSVVLVGEVIRRLLIGTDLAQSSISGVALSLVVFLTWALCRELDPDQDRSAFIAAGFGLVSALVWGSPSLGVLVWLLLIVRVVNRTTGLRASFLDSLAVLALGFWLSYSTLWVIGVITAVAFFLDGALAPPHKRQFVYGCVAALVAVIAASSGGGIRATSGLWIEGGVISLVLCGAFLPVVLAVSELRSVGDETNELLSTGRVRAGQLIALLVGVTSAVIGGSVGLVLVLPLWSAVLGASVYRVVFHRRAGTGNQTGPSGT